MTPNPVYQQAPDANGATFSFTIQLNETAGVDTTVTGFTFGGVSYAASIAQFFGSTTLPAHGTLSANLQAANIAVPSTVVMVFTGRDASGATWTQQIAVPFLPQPTEHQQLTAGVRRSRAPTVPAALVSRFASRELA